MSDTIMFQRGVDAEGRVIEVLGTPFYKTGNTGFADSVAAVQSAGLHRAPTYMFALARATAEKSDAVWSQWHNTNAEVDTVLDKEGILGKSGQLYVVDFQNGGLFVNDYSRVRSAVTTEGGLRNGAMPLGKEEVKEFFTYVKEGDVAALRQKGWLQGAEGANYIFKNGGEFTDASAAEDFLRNTPGYVVLTPADAARAESSSYQALSEQEHNLRLQIRSGGKKALKGMLDQARSFGWTQFGSHTDGYNNANSGRAVVLYNSNDGVRGISLIYNNGRSVGVAPEALEARAKIVDPAPSKVEVTSQSRTDESGIVQPSLEQVLAAGRSFVAEACWPQYEDSMRKLYE